MSATIELLPDDRVEEIRQSVAAMDDAILVDTMLTMHGRPDWRPDALLWAQLTPTTAVLTRLVFTEIATRWIPEQVFADAVARVTEFTTDLDEGGAS